MLVENGSKEKTMRDAPIVAKKVAGATAVDDLTVRVDFTAPDPRHMYQFGIAYFAFGLQWVPEHIWKDVADKAAFTNFDTEKGLPVTTSAWKVVSVASSEVICERRSDWWGAETGFRPMPGPERIVTVPSVSRDRVAQLAVSNMIDIAADIQDAELIKELIRQNARLTTFSGSEPPYGNLDWWPVSVFFNSADARWGDVRVRKAISYAINPQQIIDVAFGGAGELSKGPFPAFPPLKKYIDTCAEIATANDAGVYNPDRSAELMRAAGYEKDAAKFWAKDGKRVGGEMYGLAIVNQIGPLVQQQLRRGGFDVTFLSTPDSSKVMRAGNCPLVLSGHSNSSIFDPLATLEAFHSKNYIPVGRPSLFFARMQNPDYDAAVDPIVSLEPGDPAIEQHVRKAMEIWYRAVPEVPICQHFHRLPMNRTYWTNWPGTEDPYMPPAPNHVASSTFIAHMVKAVG
jgi:peptide/nickel transport system substrate-binding protein